MYKNDTVMEEKRVKYPIGLQDFRGLILDGFAYVDKTKFVYDLAQRGKYYFLGRPRRFGKSLLLSAMKYYFMGEKELFKGLAISELEKEWKKYPVLYFNMHIEGHPSFEQVHAMIDAQLQPYEQIYGITEKYESSTIGYYCRLENLLKTICNKTDSNYNVAILVDEYDSPFLNISPDEEDFTVINKTIMRFYNCLKSLGEYLKLVFFTGVSAFPEQDYFEFGLNIYHISNFDRYDIAWGFTEDEIKRYMHITDTELLTKLKENSGGYRFVWPSEELYNPYTLFKALADNDFASDWFKNSKPPYLHKSQIAEAMEKMEKGELFTFKKFLNYPIENDKMIVPVLYRNGFVTFKNCEDDGYSEKIVTLDVPNKYVQRELKRELA